MTHASDGSGSARDDGGDRVPMWMCPHCQTPIGYVGRALSWFFGTQFHGCAPKSPSDLALEIAESFVSSPLVLRELNSHGISSLGIEYLGERVLVRWFSCGDIYEIVIHGKRSTASGRDAAAIADAAKRRARTIIDEDLAELERKRAARRASKTARGTMP